MPYRGNIAIKQLKDENHINKQLKVQKYQQTMASFRTIQITFLKKINDTFTC